MGVATRNVSEYMLVLVHMPSSTLQIRIPAGTYWFRPGGVKGLHVGALLVSGIDSLFFSVNLITISLSLTFLFMLLPHLLTLATHRSHRP